MLLLIVVLGEFHRERGGTLGREALGVTGSVWLEGQTPGNRSILPEELGRWQPNSQFRGRFG